MGLDGRGGGQGKLMRIVLAGLVLLATLLSITPAEARRGGSGGHWQTVRACRTESCWSRHPSGFNPVRSHGRSRRHRSR